MASRISSKYASKYTKYKDGVEKAYFAHSAKSFLHYAHKSIQSFILAFIYYSFDNDKFTNDIIKRKNTYPAVSFADKRPSFEELVLLAYSSPRHSIIDTIPQRMFIELNAMLAKPNNVDEGSLPSIRSQLIRISHLFDSFSFDCGDIDKKMMKELKECQYITESGYQEANAQLRLIGNTIKEAENIIESTCIIVRNQQFNAPELVDQLVDQLRTVKVGFTSDVSKVKEEIEEKRKATDSYNITLFGRTNVGKSTLMEILTNGSGISIGKGGQRTTTDVRKYQWKGLSITDVPGIDAYDGRLDEVLAERASRFADQLIFLITSGQPESIEADWLVKLKRMDKPILCVCNVKKTVSSEKYLESFLNNPGNVLDKDRVSEAIQQFREFVKQELPNEDLPFVTTHLQTRFLANGEKDEAKKLALIEASRFRDVENAILCDVINYGKLYRKRCYLTILDVPIFEQMTRLFSFSSINFHNVVLYEEKQRDFKAWQVEFVADELGKLENSITMLFDKIERRVATFVDENAESKDFGKKWNRFIDQQRLEAKIESLLEHSYNKARLHIESIFRELSEELSFSQSVLMRQYFMEGRRIVDWGKGFGWGAGVLGVISTIMFFIPVVREIGITIGIVGAILGGIATIWKSRERRLREYKEKQVNRLRESVREQKAHTIQVANNEFEKMVENQLINEANTRFSMLIDSLKTLAWSQRRIGFIYQQNHNKLSEKSIQDILISMGQKRIRLFNVARVPGKKTVLVSDSEVLEDEFVRSKISSMLGSKETIVSIKLPNPLSFSVSSFNMISERIGSSLKNPKYSYDSYLDEDYLVLRFISVH